MLTETLTWRELQEKRANVPGRDVALAIAPYRIVAQGTNATFKIAKGWRYHVAMTVRRICETRFIHTPEGWYFATPGRVYRCHWPRWERVF